MNYDIAVEKAKKATEGLNANVKDASFLKVLDHSLAERPSDLHSKYDKAVSALQEIASMNYSEPAKFALKELGELNETN